MAKKSAVTVVSVLEKIQGVANDLTDDAVKCDKGNNAAGTRVRKGAQEIKALCKELRDVVTEVKQAKAD